MSEHPSIFTDAILEANIVHNVVRLRMGQVAAGGKLVPSGTLLVPLQQLGAVTNAFTRLLQQLEARNGPDGAPAPTP